MALNIQKEVAALNRLSVKQLRERYATVFGEATQACNRDWLVKRIAWRLQAQAEGDLSARARQRAEELANDADLRTTAPKKSPVVELARTHTTTATLPVDHDNRLPPPGSVIIREYMGGLSG